MAKRTYTDKTNEPYKQIKLSEGWYTDSNVTESDYMALSPKWKKLREERLRIDNQRCVQCGAAYPINVHHRRYPAVWGDEKVEDLVTLCDSCHRKVHNVKEV